MVFGNERKRKEGQKYPTQENPFFVKGDERGEKISKISHLEIRDTSDREKAV